MLLANYCLFYFILFFKLSCPMVMFLFPSGVIVSHRNEMHFVEHLTNSTILQDFCNRAASHDYLLTAFSSLFTASRKKSAQFHLLKVTIPCTSHILEQRTGTRWL